MTYGGHRCRYAVELCAEACVPEWGDQMVTFRQEENGVISNTVSERLALTAGSHGIGERGDLHTGRKAGWLSC
jgi:hypothetical protein